MANYNWNGNAMPNWQVQYPSVTNTPVNPYWPYQNDASNPYRSYQNSFGTSYGNEIIWVQGEAGAKAYPVSSGSTILLMDSEKNRFYIKSVGQNGIPMKLRVFDYKEIVDDAYSAIPAPSAETYVTKAEFDELKQMLDERLPYRKDNRSKDNSNGKSTV